MLLSSSRRPSIKNIVLKRTMAFIKSVEKIYFHLVGCKALVIHTDYTLAVVLS